MNIQLKRAVLAVLFGTTLVASAVAQVTVTIYDGFTESGGGTPFSNPVGTFSNDLVDFASSTGFNWHPFDRNAFGALVEGTVTVAKDGNYTFGTTSDDGSLLYFNNALYSDNGGAHGPQTIFGAPTFFTAGQAVSFKIEFFESFGGNSGLDMVMKDDAGNTVLVPKEYFKAVPEPGSILALSAGFAILISRRRRR